ncbi:S-adenosyl-L-methionine-dependent methyltransferase [Stipitochalara longipes BDJ]|nr:S-adenosyl-L-methionine-dependent methyltransferase [Stipitochalara longipes BDJ]
MASSNESGPALSAVDGDKVQPLATEEEISSSVEKLAAVTPSQDSEPTEPTATRPNEHPDPASEIVAPLSHHDAAEEPSLPIVQNDEPSSHEQVGIEVAEAPSVAALSVDSEERDNDSALGNTSIYTTNTSARSSVYDFVFENGRTYHSYREGKYELPNDEREQDRLDLQHHLFLLTLGGDLYNAPIKDLPGGLHNALDIGTGTGIWAIDFATEFPSANVIGTDLSPIQPPCVPPNLHFEVDDAEDPWLFSNQFDYIHGRALATCFKSHMTVIKSAYNFTRPGGYFELQDCIVPFRCMDDSMKGTTIERWVDLIMQATARIGKDWTRVKKYKEYLEEAGFVDVVEKKYEWPVGTWAKGKREKMLGLWYREDLLSGLQGFTMALLTRALGMTTVEVELLLTGVREDIKSNKIHIYIPVRVVYGRKPL